jgi:hypothetical protein
MFTAIDVKAVKKYISPNDPDQNNPTVFWHGIIDPALTSWIEGKCFNATMNDKGKDVERTVNINVTKHDILTVKYGLRNIENFTDPEGNPVQIQFGNHNILGINYNAVPDEILNMLGVQLIKELAEQIVGNQTVTEEQKKN